MIFKFNRIIIKLIILLKSFKLYFYLFYREVKFKLKSQFIILQIYIPSTKKIK
jgi:hypothetical protein